MSVLAVVLTLTSPDENWMKDSGAGETDAFRPHWPAILALLEELAPRQLPAASVLLTIRVTPGTALNLTPGQLAMLTLAQCALRVELV